MTKRSDFTNRQLANPVIDLSWADAEKPLHIKRAIEELTQALGRLTIGVNKVRREAGIKPLIRRR